MGAPSVQSERRTSALPSDPSAIREVVHGWPAMLWLRDGTVQPCVTPDFTRDAWCGLHGVPHTDRADPLALLCEPFLDTEFTESDATRTAQQLGLMGFSADDIRSLRANLREPMLSYNAILWDWTHLGLFDVLAAMPGPAAATSAWCSRLISQAWEAQGPVPSRPPVGVRPRDPLSEVLATAAGSVLREGWSARRDWLREEIATAYAEPQRHYHTARHLEEAWAIGRSSLTAARGTEDDQRMLAWTVLYHDVVYVPGRTDNEAVSATRCDAAMQRLGEQAEIRATVTAAILWSARHDRHTADSRLLRAFFDADLGVLGLSPARYAEYAGQVRDEYVGAGVPAEAFRQGRLRFARQLLAELKSGPWYFALDPVHDDLAIRNVRAEIEALSIS